MQLVLGPERGLNKHLRKQVPLGVRAAHSNQIVPDRVQQIDHLVELALLKVKERVKHLRAELTVQLFEIVALFLATSGLRNQHGQILVVLDGSTGELFERVDKLERVLRGLIGRFVRTCQEHGRVHVVEQVAVVLESRAVGVAQRSPTFGQVERGEVELQSVQE